MILSCSLFNWTLSDKFDLEIVWMSFHWLLIELPIDGFNKQNKNCWRRQLLPFDLSIFFFYSFVHIVYGLWEIIKLICMIIHQRDQKRAFLLLFADGKYLCGKWHWVVSVNRVCTTCMYVTLNLIGNLFVKASRNYLIRVFGKRFFFIGSYCIGKKKLSSCNEIYRFSSWAVN